MLTPKQQRFVEEYLIDLNATAAAKRAGYSDPTAYSQGQRLLKNVEVAAALEKAQARRAAKTEITAERVLEELWSIATADPNELIQFRRGACSSCYGGALGLLDEETLEDQPHGGALRRARKANGSVVRDEDPDPDCPECAGEGVGRAFITDTRQLSPAGKRLYAGVKITKEGVEVKMHDKASALVSVGKHLGMFADKLDVNVTGDLAVRLLAGRQRARGGA